MTRVYNPPRKAPATGLPGTAPHPLGPPLPLAGEGEENPFLGTPPTLARVSMASPTDLDPGVPTRRGCTPIFPRPASVVSQQQLYSVRHSGLDPESRLHGLDSRFRGNDNLVPGLTREW
jgi:hypothetical protein